MPNNITSAGGLRGTPDFTEIEARAADLQLNSIVTFAQGATTGRNNLLLDVDYLRGVGRSLRAQSLDRNFFRTITPADIGEIRGARADCIVLDDILDAPLDAIAQGFDYGQLARDVAAEVGWGFAPRRVRCRQLVPVGPLRHVTVERFDGALLAEIERPTERFVVEQRKQQNRAWAELLRKNAERRVAEAIPHYGRLYYVALSALFYGNTRLNMEVQRLWRMLVESTFVPDDIHIYTLGGSIGPRAVQKHVTHVVFVSGPLRNDVRVVDVKDYQDAT